jgi:hypothetical protein
LSFDFFPRLQQSHIDLAHPESALARDGVSRERPRYAVYAKNPDSGYLKHVHLVLDRAGEFEILRENNSEVFSLFFRS